MSREPSHSFVPLALSLLLAAGMLAVLPGCQGGDSDDATVGKSKYAPVRDDEPGDDELGDDDATPPASEPETNPLIAQAPGAAEEPDAAEQPAPKQPQGLAGQPPRKAAPAKKPVSYDVPDGSPAELNAYIERLNERLQEMLSQAQSLEEIRDEAVKNLDAQIAAAEKILASDPAEEVRAEAVMTKARAIQAKFQFDIPGAEERLNAMIEELAKDPNADLQRTAAVYRLLIPLTKLRTGRIEESEPVLAALDAFLEEIEDTDASTFGYAAEAVQTFQMLGRMDDWISSMRAVGRAYEGSENPQVALQAMMYLLESAQYLEYMGRPDEAQEIYAALAPRVEQLENPEVKAELQKALEFAKTRGELLGGDLALEELDLVNLEGKPIDWSQFKDKVVLVDFWATWCGPCIREFPNIYEAYTKYKDQGLEVIGVNMDDSIEDVHQFFRDFSQQAADFESVEDESTRQFLQYLSEHDSLPWTIGLPADPEERGMEGPIAEEFGINAIPFMLLVDRQGKVAATYVQGERLEPAIREALGLPEEKAAPADEKAEGQKPDADAGAVEEEPAKTLPEEKQPAQPQDKNAPSADAAASKKETPAESELDLPLQPADQDDAVQEVEPNEDDSAARDADQRQFFVALDEDSDEPKDGDDAGAEKAADRRPARNPYLASPDLSTFELVEFLLEMQDKPRVIQQRPGFAEAIADAADRILADEKAKGKFQIIAITTKLHYLHDAASYGDEQTDAALTAFVAKLQNDPREQVAREVKFLQLERRALEADKLSPQEREELLAELKAYFEEHRDQLGEKHLRIASATVGAINLIEDGDAREERFNEFGSLFAASSNRELAAYGKRLATAAPVSSLVGKPLELDGLTELGVPLNWQAYRGKVVVVDFWATWCGPCRQSMPVVKAFHENRRADGFDVVGVNLDEDQEALARFLSENKLPWTNLTGEDSQRLAGKYGVHGYPTFVLVDREGKVLEVSHAFEALQPKIEELLKAS